MGETTPPGVTGRDGQLDGGAAREALAALGREGSLDVALDRLAEVVGLRFGADCVVVGVQRR
ncbi:hypothetical protein, partial [Tepidiforma sp.]|uniref:hypothetical protein n=1 Tax=Tepidiforma sp. TaxID=2682230 RepID=UPI002ADD64FC